MCLGGCHGVVSRDQLNRQHTFISLTFFPDMAPVLQQCWANVPDGGPTLRQDTFISLRSLPADGRHGSSAGSMSGQTLIQQQIHVTINFDIWWTVLSGMAVYIIQLCLLNVPDVTLVRRRHDILQNTIILQA